MKRLRRIDDGKSVLVTAFADYNPLQQLNPLSSELADMQFCGRVMFDLLCINGNADNRFVTIFFDGSKFDRNSFSILFEIDSFLKNEQDILFCNNPDLLQGTVLSSSELMQFKNH
jgi:hypothetical protein